MLERISCSSLCPIHRLILQCYHTELSLSFIWLLDLKKKKKTNETKNIVCGYALV